MNILSGADLFSEFNNLTGTNVILSAFYPEPIWKAPTMGGRWVSYAQTGPSGVEAPGTTTAGSPTAVFTKTFVLSGTALAGSQVTFWADDTASVLLDGSPAISLGSAAKDLWCVSSPIGCQPSKSASINLAGLGAGSHTLTISAYQLYTNAFGVLYEGTVILADIPEPSTFALLSLGLASLLVIRRRRA